LGDGDFFFLFPGPPGGPPTFRQKPLETGHFPTELTRILGAPGPSPAGRDGRSTTLPADPPLGFRETKDWCRGATSPCCPARVGADFSRGILRGTAPQGRMPSEGEVSKKPSPPAGEPTGHRITKHPRHRRPSVDLRALNGGGASGGKKRARAPVESHEGDEFGAGPACLPSPTGGVFLGSRAGHAISRWRAEGGILAILGPRGPGSHKTGPAGGHGIRHMQTAALSIEQKKKTLAPRSI